VPHAVARNAALVIEAVAPAQRKTGPLRCCP
jgi:hypothetical protein